MLLHNARLLDPGSGLDRNGALLLKQDRIEAIDPPKKDIPADTPRLDCGGHILAPGLIDICAFTGEPGSEYRETLASASDAAAAGGITSFAVMPDTNPVIDNIALVDFLKRRARATAKTHVYPLAALTKECKGKSMTEIALLRDAGALAFTDGEHALMDSQLMRRIMEYAADTDALIVQYALEPYLRGDGVMHEGALATRLGLKGIPPAAETSLIERDLRLVELTGVRYHIAQASCSDSVELVRAAKDKGLPVTCGVAATHLALTQDDVGEYRSFLKLMPPLRSEADRLALVDGLQEGVIDVIISNHVPEDPETKRQPFAIASFGSVGLETMLAASLTPVAEGRLSLERALEAMTIAPARLLGLDAGRLAVGAPADLVVFDPKPKWRVDADALRSKAHNSAFDEHELQGRILHTLVSGEIVFSADAKDA